MKQMHGGTTEPKPTQSDARDAALTVVNLFKRWQLSDREACNLLGGLSLSTYRRWKQGKVGKIGPDLLLRVGNLLGIHAALRLLFMDRVPAYEWVRKPNEIYGGKSALEFMLSGDITSIIDVRRYLDAECV